MDGGLFHGKPYWTWDDLGGKTPKWMVKIMENPMNKWMIWVFSPLFLGWVDTHIYDIRVDMTHSHIRFLMFHGTKPEAMEHPWESAVVFRCFFFAEKMLTHEMGEAPRWINRNGSWVGCGPPHRMQSWPSQPGLWTIFRLGDPELNLHLPLASCEGAISKSWVICSVTCCFLVYFLVNPPRKHPIRLVGFGSGLCFYNVSSPIIGQWWNGATIGSQAFLDPQMKTSPPRSKF